MSHTQVRLAVVIGSVRPERFGPTVADWFVGETQHRDDVQVDLVDLAADSTGSPPTAQSPGLAHRLAAADAFVVVTPEYNHSYPAALKNMIDTHGREFRAKPVAFVSYGGLSGGLRAVEHLRPVFAELHAVTTRDTVSFHGAWKQFDGAGQPKDPAAPAAAAGRLLDQLTWWARALQAAKATSPYPA
ncbi:NADPH-dependent FMN reductase [Catellatospora citrea]|uniref:FMN reductase n=1 Tax=Catellatospora citrea TaxID=53366 RepID=A0A8J3P629_9ACTN|nr:NAD(P)H-dependent oxidoreductase [Catellatospora citrea]RKE12053.1 NAD(P)H-dependent FMN reductase [Catellatospora citrea]GIG02996.1 FMN reductase [Catellatospora citrea]